MVERGSTRHSPRVDDAMEQETQSLVRGAPTESRADEARQKEPAADGEPAPDALPRIDAIELRSHLAMSLRPSAFPGNRSRLIAVAEEEFADDAALALLHALPADREFVNVEEVWVALGGETERRVAEPQPSPTGTSAEQVMEREPGEPESSLYDRVRSAALTGADLLLGLAVVTVRKVIRRR